MVLSIIFDLERTNQLSLLPDKDLVDLCPPIEPYQVKKNQNNRHRLSQEFNIIPERVPSYSTIIRVMMGVDGQSLLKMFNEWALQ